MADTRIVSGGQNETPITALHVRALARANAIPVLLVNASGDIYNALAGGGSTTNFTGINGVTPSVNAGNADTGTLRVVVASDQATIPISFQTPVTGVQIVGGSVGGTVGISGDSPFTIGKITAPVGISGDVSTKPLAGQTWPVSIAASVPVTFSSQIGVNIIGGSIGSQVQPSGDFPVRLAAATAPIGISGDVSTIPKAGQTWPVSFPGGISIGAITAPIGITGDVSTTPKAGQTWPVSVTGTINTSQQSVVGVQVLGGSVGSTIGISGDAVVNAVQRGAWAVGITGDVNVVVTVADIMTVGNVVGTQLVGGSIGGRVSISGDSLNVVQQGIIGVQVVGGQSGGSVGISGDVAIKPSATTNIGRFPVSGDTGLTDGADRTILATVRDYSNSNPLAVVLTNASGDVYNSSTNISVLAATYGVKNITTTATMILNRNNNRLAAYIQNVERQQMYIGFDANLTVVNGGIVLAPTVNSSGDGGSFGIDKYTGTIYAILASGDADVRYVET